MFEIWYNTNPVLNIVYSLKTSQRQRGIFLNAMKTVNHKFEFFLCILRALESLWQKINQKQQIMQNKPNLLNAQMNVNTVKTKDYENERPCRRGKNKAKTNPIQSQSKPISKGIPYCSAASCGSPTKTFEGRGRRVGGCCQVSRLANSLKALSSCGLNGSVRSVGPSASIVLSRSCSFGCAQG